MKQAVLALTALLLASLAAICGAADIAVDDLNDRFGCLGGNPQAIAPKP